MTYVEIYKAGYPVVYRIARSIFKNDTSKVEPIACTLLSTLWKNRKILQHMAFPPQLLCAILVKRYAGAYYNAQHTGRRFEQFRWSYLQCGNRTDHILNESDALMLCIPQKELDILLLHTTFTLDKISQLMEISEVEAAHLLISGKRRTLQLLEDDEVPITEQELRDSADRAIQDMVTISKQVYLKWNSENYLEQPAWEICSSVLKRHRNMVFKGYVGQIPQVKHFLYPIHRQVFLLILLLSCTIMLDYQYPYFETNFIQHVPHSWSKIFRLMGTDGTLGDRNDNSMYQPTASLYDLHYTLTFVPEGFYRTEHYWAETVSHDYYRNAQGDKILFSQQVLEEQVIDFDLDQFQLELFLMNGHKAAIEFSLGLYKIYWFQGQYAYTFSTTLPKSTAIYIASHIRLQASDSDGIIPMFQLPESYTKQLAVENQDVILEQGAPIENLERLKLFIKNCSNNRNDVVRISFFYENGNVWIANLQYQEGGIYYTLDRHRDMAQIQPREIGERYDRIELLSVGDETKLILYALDSPKPLEVVSFQSNNLS